MIKWKSKWSFS